MIRPLAGKPLRVFVVWEPVLEGDAVGPSTATLNRISDSRVSQYWDSGLLISHSMREGGSRGVVWDFMAVYSPGATWHGSPPQPLFEGGPVAQAIQPAAAMVAQALHKAAAPARK
jgi:hypothetical protein